MLDIVRSSQRYHFETDWLSTYWHFSFDHYYDPENVSFGPLRVFNDDVIAPGGGFPTHPHREMEIITLPLVGRLEHRDSTGGRGIVGPGEVQRMSAGTGVQHSEFNASKTEPVHLLQIWVLPAERRLPPSYEQKSYASSLAGGRFVPVASGDESLWKNGAVRIHQDTAFNMAQIEPGAMADYQIRPGRRAYIFVPEGKVTLAGSRSEVLSSGDVAKTAEESRLSFKAEKSSQVLLIDLP